MAFWSDPSSLFPKQSHRWVVFLEKERDPSSREIPHYLVKSVDRPSYKIDTLQAKYLYSHTFNFPKRLVWNPIKIELYDVFWVEKTQDTSVKTTQKFLYDFLQNSGYYDPDEGTKSNDQLNRFRSYHFKKNMITALTGQALEGDLLNKKSDDNTKDYIYLAELDGDGTVIEQWKIYNPLITDISPTRLDYSSDNILSITVGITYDWAELSQRDRNIKPPSTEPQQEDAE